MSSEPDIPGDLRDLARLGVVLDRDLAARVCTVEIGDLKLPRVRWGSLRMGAFRLWAPPSIGEQVLVISPEGDSAQAVIVASLPSNAHPAPTALDALWFDADDGSRVVYDPAAHTLTAALCEGGKVIVTAPAGVEITGDVTVTGDLTLNGKATVTGDVLADGDVKAGAISLKTHKHPGVQPGPNLTGVPQ